MILLQFETHSPPFGFFIPVVADDFEGSYFRGVFYVRSQTKTFVIIAYFHYAYSFRSIFRQSFQVKASLCFFLRDEFCGNIQSLRNHCIYGFFQSFYIFFGRSSFQSIVQLTFLSLYMCGYLPSTAEKIHHGTVDYMLAGVHGWVFLFVVVVELNLLFHNRHSYFLDIRTKVQIFSYELFFMFIFSEFSFYFDTFTSKVY